MDFSGFSNSDFDFFKRKNFMDKMEYDKSREEVKRHFREFCYEIQKIYYGNTGKTLILDKDFHGLNKNKDSLVAKSEIVGIDFVNLKIELCKDSISVKLACPPDGDYEKFEAMKQKIVSMKNVFLRFFKENKSMFIILFKRNSKKTGDDDWKQEFKFDNNELVLGNYKILIDNMNRLQPVPLDNKKMAGIYIGVQFLKSDASRMGKALASRACGEIIKLLDLIENII